MRIPVSEPHIGTLEIENALEALKTGWISGLKGKFLDEFEQKMSKFCGVKHGVACSSGTAALQLATRILDIGPGDEVIVPTFTNIASVLCIYYNGAKPVLVDADPETWSMSSDIESKITSKTKAVIPVHIYGHPVQMDELCKIAKENNLFIIEDCAEAHGAEVNKKKVGSFSDIACFSFYSNKIISTGEGGMIITDNEEYARKAKQYASLAFSQNDRYQHEFLAYNFRLSNILAGIGAAQLSNIEKFIEKKRWIAAEYNKNLSDIDGIQIPVEKPWARNVYWMYGIVLNKNFNIDRNTLMEKLDKEGIETRAFFTPMHLQTVFNEKQLFINESYPVSENLGRNGLYLPCSVNISKEDIEKVSNTIKKISGF